MRILIVSKNWIEILRIASSAVATLRPKIDVVHYGIL